MESEIKPIPLTTGGLSTTVAGPTASNLQYSAVPTAGPQDFNVQYSVSTAPPGSNMQYNPVPLAGPPGSYVQYNPGPPAGPPGSYVQYNPGPPAGPPGSYVQYNPVPAAPTLVPAPNSPSGLEYLANVDQLLVHQQVELVEALTGFETNNKYQIKNALGQPVYFAAEENDFCTRNMCGPARPFKMNILDNFGRPVMVLDRPLRCQACCCFCCLQRLHVFSPPDRLIGVVKQNCSLCIPSFDICNENEEPVLKIIGPFCQVRCCSDVKFNVFSLDGKTKVGCISKQWSGLLNEAFTDADNFGVSFPMDLDVKVKATLFAATFLIDFMYFEDNADSNRHH